MATKSTRRPPVPEDAAQQGQLRLVVDPPSAAEHTPPARWRLDDETKAVGREGLARARAVLNASRPSLVEPAA